MKKVVKILMGIAIAIFVFCGLGSLGHSDYAHAVNSESYDKAYTQFVKDGHIGNGEKYTITNYASDANGIVKTYKLDVKEGKGQSTYFYCVNSYNTRE